MDPYIRRATIVSIYDADTIRADVDLGYGLTKHNEAFRLYGIDAPEVRGPEREQGLAARDALRALIPVGSEVAIESIKGDDKGKYGRYLAIIHLEQRHHAGAPTWLNVNEWLMAEGHAEAATY